MLGGSRTYQVEEGNGGGDDVAPCVRCDEEETLNARWNWTGWNLSWRFSGLFVTLQDPNFY